MMVGGSVVKLAMSLLERSLRVEPLNSLYMTEHAYQLALLGSFASHSYLSLSIHVCMLMVIGGGGLQISMIKPRQYTQKLPKLTKEIFKHCMVPCRAVPFALCCASLAHLLLSWFKPPLLNPHHVRLCTGSIKCKIMMGNFRDAEQGIPCLVDNSFSIVHHCCGWYDV
jgi:hypothetical protein